MTVDTQGIEAGRYRVVPRSLVFVRCGDRLLLLRRASESRIWPGCYNGVGGHVEAGEDLADSARREVFEETGLRVRQLRLAGLIHASDEDAPEGVLVIVFTAEADGDAVEASREGTLHWLSPSDVEALDLVPDVPAILPRLWPEEGQPPFVAFASPGGEEAVRFAREG